MCEKPRSCYRGNFVEAFGIGPLGDDEQNGLGLVTEATSLRRLETQRRPPLVRRPRSCYRGNFVEADLVSVTVGQVDNASVLLPRQLR